MTDTKLRELLVVIDDHYGRARSLEERRADTQIYIRAFGTIPDEIVEKALYTAFTQCRFQNQLIVDWCAEIKKLLSAQQPSANDLWAQAAAAARKIEANLYYQTHGGFIAPDGRKLKGEDFKKENAKIFAALPMVVQRWAGSPADLSEIFSSRSSADLRQFVRLGYKATVKDLALELVEKAELSIMGSGQGAKKKKQVFAALRAKCPAAIRWAITDEVLDAVIEHAFDVMTAALGKKS